MKNITLTYTEAKLCFATPANGIQAGKCYNISFNWYVAKILILKRQWHTQYSVRLRSESSQARASDTSSTLIKIWELLRVVSGLGSGRSLWYHKSLRKCDMKAFAQVWHEGEAELRKAGNINSASFPKTWNKTAEKLPQTIWIFRDYGNKLRLP